MRVKKLKIGKRVSTFMAFALMATFLVESVPVKAQQENIILPSEVVEEVTLDTEISPRGALCPDCNIGEMRLSYSAWGNWYHYQEVDCTHFPYGTDEVFLRSRTVTEECTYCGKGDSTQQYQTKIVCHGYN